MRLTLSGANPGDTKKRQAWLRSPMAFPRIVPHSDGAGVIEAVGLGADLARVSQRAWVYGAQSYRPFGTAAQTTVVPEALAVDLPAAVSDEMGHAWMCWHRRASFVPPGGGAGRAAVLDWGRRLGVPPIRWAAAGSSVLVTGAAAYAGPADQMGCRPAPRLRPTTLGAVGRSLRRRLASITAWQPVRKPGPRSDIEFPEYLAKVAR